MADSDSGPSIGNTGMVIVIVGAIFASVYMVGTSVSLEGEMTRAHVVSLSAKIDVLNSNIIALKTAARAAHAAPAAEAAPAEVAVAAAAPAEAAPEAAPDEAANKE